MSKRAYNLLLILVVITLWIVIGARLHVLIKNPSRHNREEPISYLPKSERDVDTIRLTLDYRDPFLSKTYSRIMPTDIKSASATLSKAISAKKEDLKWPVIIYSGMVKSSNGLSSVAVLTIDGKPSLIKNNEEIYGLRSICISQDSLVIEYKSEKRSFKKSTK